MHTGVVAWRLGRLFSSVCATTAVVLGASAAHAGFLTSATWTSESFGWAPEVISVVVPVAATGTSTSASIAVSLTIPAFSMGAFVPALPVLYYTHRRLTLGGAQALTATPSMAAVSMGVAGSRLIQVARHTKGSMPGLSISTGLRFPLHVGASDVSTDYFYVLAFPHYATLNEYGWTPGTRVFTGLTSKFAPLPTAVAMGSFMLTPLGGGTVLLVSPSKLAIDGGLFQRRTVSLTSLKLIFVPEPGAWLMLGAGALALARFRRQSAYGNTT